MTALLSLRRKPAARPRRRILAARDSWRLVADKWCREIVVRDYDGQVRRTYMPDEHPALVAFLERAAERAEVAA
jgi:hypothetical protein